MPFYTGRTADGSDIREVEGGVYVNPNNPDEWSSKAYPGKQRRDQSTYDEVIEYMNGRYTLSDVYKQVIDKICPLSKRCRDFVESHYDTNGKFMY